MTDTSTPAEEPAAAEEVAPEPAPPVPQEILDKLAAIKEAVAAEDAAVAAAVKSQEDADAKLMAAKQDCFNKCQPISDAIAATTDFRERELLQQLENQTHEEHRAALEQSYLEHSGRPPIASAPPGVTNIESHASMSTSGDASAQQH